MNLENNKVFIVGEIGLNANGSLKIAKKLIDMAKECGCDAVKFQKRNPDICIPSWKKNEIKETPWGKITYMDYKKKIEFNRNDYNEIDKYCKVKKIEWFASAWDLDSLSFLKKYNLKYNKLASPLLTNESLVKAIANEKKMTFISTGISDFSIIDNVVSIFHEKKCPFILLHCVSTYPTIDSEINLNMIPILHDRYKCDIGFSDHSKGILASSLAVMLKAKVIEKHITLDRTSFGTDQANSIERRGLELIVRNIRNVDKMLGDGIKKVLEEEKIKLESIKYW